MNIAKTQAETIIEQMGGRRFAVMVGMSHSLMLNDGVELIFKAKAANKANRVRITLDPSDTYTVTFIRVHGLKVTEISQHEGIYADRLQPLFNEETKLYTHF